MKHSLTKIGLLAVFFMTYGVQASKNPQNVLPDTFKMLKIVQPNDVKKLNEVFSEIRTYGINPTSIPPKKVQKENVYKQLFEAIKAKDPDKIRNILKEHPLLKYQFSQKLKLSMNDQLQQPTASAGHNNQFKTIVFYLNLLITDKLGQMQELPTNTKMNPKNTKKLEKK